MGKLSASFSRLPLQALLTAGHAADGELGTLGGQEFGHGDESDFNYSRVSKPSTSRESGIGRLLGLGYGEAYSCMEYMTLS